MSVFLSLSNVTVIGNGHTFNSFASANDAVQFDQVEIAQVEYGANRDMIASSVGQDGGSMTLKLLANSEDVAYMQQRITEQQNGSVIIWKFTINYNDINAVTRCTGGVLTDVPLAQTIGSGISPVMEYTWMFQKIESDYSQARMQPPTLRS